MKIKISDLTGPALDWAVCMALGQTVRADRLKHFPRAFLNSPTNYHSPSTDWTQGGPIIERERIETRHNGRTQWCAWRERVGAVHGPTLLVAAMRCFVASKLGEDVEIPKELWI